LIKKIPAISRDPPMIRQIFPIRPEKKSATEEFIKIYRKIRINTGKKAIMLPEYLL